MAMKVYRFANTHFKLENKIGNIFLSGQNQSHSTGVKKSYFNGGWTILETLDSIID